MKKKRYSIILIGASLIMFFQTSCLKEYLDKAPDAGIDENAVFSQYANFESYFNSIYSIGVKPSDSPLSIKNAFSFYFNCWDQKSSIDAMTDMADMGRIMIAQTVKGGFMGNGSVNMWLYDNNRRPVFAAMWRCIRICNMTLEKINDLKDASDKEKADFIAQAYLIRGFAHFTLVKWWGGMPYLTKVLGSGDEWDIPRLSSHETLLRVAQDMDSAVVYFEKAGAMRRDNPDPAGAGHLNNPNLYKPNGCTALALKGRALLYAASPLNNVNGKADWEAAAKANATALDTALKYGYTMLSKDLYGYNFYNVRYSEEELWGYAFKDGSTENFAYNRDYNNGGGTYFNGVFANSKSNYGGINPSQNMVDMFETKWGDPLNTDADRQAAIAAGHYKDQDPYANRDPRFYKDIIYNECPLVGFGTAKIYYTRNSNGSLTYSELLDQSYAGITHTGYYMWKRTGDVSYKNKVSPLITDPIIRITELYLNYAEAANEAYGPNGGVPGFRFTASQALQQVRDRMQMPAVASRYLTDADAFRPRIKNERNVELCFEDHYYFDIRRWKDAPIAMAGPMMGMDIEKVNVSATYPKGYKYTRVPLPDNRQVHWKDAMYYLPFLASDQNKMSKFVFNEPW